MPPCTMQQSQLRSTIPRSRTGNYRQSRGATDTLWSPCAVSDGAWQRFSSPAVVDPLLRRAPKAHRHRCEAVLPPLLAAAIARALPEAKLAVLGC
eukprot:scaffold48705_cov90-Phaeocystis_antarctica.AAC.1